MSFYENRNMSAASYPSDSPLIVLDHITKVFKSASGEAVALKDIQVEIYQGEFVSVVGRSGSGKSTLANMITGIDHPTSGTIQVGNTVLNNMQESPMSIWRGKNLGIVFQFFQLLPMLNLVENVMLPMDFSDYLSPDDREERSLMLLDKVGLRDLAYQLPSAISGGEQQSTAVARALANDPPILIADEPTGNLDSKTAEAVMELFEELSTQGKTILMVTHDNSLANRTQRKLVISDGELIPEAISGAFPDLDHSNLLELAHLGTLLEISARQKIPSALTGHQVLLITKGIITLESKKGKVIQIAGEKEIVGGPLKEETLINPGQSGTARALLFPRDAFERLTDPSARQSEPEQDHPAHKENKKEKTA